MTPLCDLRHLTPLTSAQMAHLLDLHPVTYWQWENRKRTAPKWVKREMVRIAIAYMAAKPDHGLFIRAERW